MGALVVRIDAERRLVLSQRLDDGSLLGVERSAAWTYSRAA